MKNMEADAAKYRESIARLEARIQKEELSLVASDRHFQDQINERNQLLMTIFNYLERILGVEKTLVSYPFKGKIYSRTKLHK